MPSRSVQSTSASLASSAGVERLADRGERAVGFEREFGLVHGLVRSVERTGAGGIARASRATI
jgi:hypothetical protein